MQTSAPHSLMNSIEPSSSGAIVTTRMPGSLRNSSRSGLRMNLPFCAPLRFSLMYGPSMWKPRMLVPGTSVLPSVTALIASKLWVMVVGSHEVVPFLPRNSHISANSPSMVSLPTQPCACISTSPGMTERPVQSSPDAAADAGAIAVILPPSTVMSVGFPSKRTFFRIM